MRSDVLNLKLCDQCVCFVWTAVMDCACVIPAAIAMLLWLPFKSSRKYLEVPAFMKTLKHSILLVLSFGVLSHGLPWINLI
jgi:hypothetical protein